MFNANFLAKITPSVSRSCLLMGAGIMWTCVGITLSVVASYRLFHMEWPQNLLGGLGGAALGLVCCRYGFIRVAEKNIARILGRPERNCFFAFQTWRGYGLIFVMMFMGHVLRHSPLPPIIPAVIYLTVGVALTLSSSTYYEFAARACEKIKKGAAQGVPPASRSPSKSVKPFTVS